jgi:predicted XRE-type DNA-binding protein
MRRGDQNKRTKAAAVEPDRTVEASSGNVFADLDLPAPEEMLAKAQLVQRIGDILAERKLTQARAAAVLGVDQPKISALLRGRFNGFSTERLFRFLNALGQDVEIVVRRPRRGRGMGATRVVGL